jgi:hypothetical protein
MQVSPTPDAAKRRCAAGKARIAVVARCRRSSGADQSNSSSTSTVTRKRVLKTAGQSIRSSALGGSGLGAGSAWSASAARRLSRALLPAERQRQHDPVEPDGQATAHLRAQLVDQPQRKPVPSSGAPSR